MVCGEMLIGLHGEHGHPYLYIDNRPVSDNVLILLFVLSILYLRLENYESWSGVQARKTTVQTCTLQFDKNRSIGSRADLCQIEPEATQVALASPLDHEF